MVAMGYYLFDPIFFVYFNYDTLVSTSITSNVGVLNTKIKFKEHNNFFCGI